MTKKDFAYVIKLKILRWRGYPGLCRWALNAFTCILIKGSKGKFEDAQKRRKSHDGNGGKKSQRNDAVLLTLKMEEGTMSQGMQGM